VISQQLIPKAGGQGRALALEIMVPNPAIRNLIREDKVHQIYSMMQTGQAKYGMQTMNQSLAELYQRRQISYDEAMGRSSLPEELLGLIGRAAGAPAASSPAREQRINR
jgi:twitching motility protein PilT